MTAMDATALGEVCAGLKNAAREEWTRLSVLQRKIEGKLVSTWTPANADLEYKDLFRKASSPWLLFARDVMAQGLRIDGYDNLRVWADAWQANGMDARQVELNREVIALGKSYLMTLPADGGGVVMRPLSVLDTFAVYADPWDEYPQYVLHRAGKKKASYWQSDWYFFDSDAMYRFHGDPAAPEEMTKVEHGQAFTPVVMVSNSIAISGEPKSSLEAAIPVYQRVVDATFTLQMVQRYGAFPQKWMAGGEIATDENGNSLVRSSVDGLLHAKGEAGETARFGTFDSADLNQVVAALEAHLKHLFSMLQVPPHYGLGSVINMSDSGITAAESNYHRNISDRKTSLGEGYELALRTAAAILGETEAADDTSSQVHWDDVTTYTLAEVGDAVVKLASVDAPLEMLFAMIPGWSKLDALEAAQHVRDRIGTQTDVTDISAQVKAQADALGVLVRAGVDPKEAADRVGLGGVGFTGLVPVALRNPEDGVSAPQ